LLWYLASIRNAHFTALVHLFWKRLVGFSVIDCATSKIKPGNMEMSRLRQYCLRYWTSRPRYTFGCSEKAGERQRRACKQPLYSKNDLLVPVSRRRGRQVSALLRALQTIIMTQYSAVTQWSARSLDGIISAGCLASLPAVQATNVYAAADRQRLEVLGAFASSKVLVSIAPGHMVVRWFTAGCA
jgi:hypothetical protein